jgi:hypothetical protein
MSFTLHRLLISFELAPASGDQRDETLGEPSLRSSKEHYSLRYILNEGEHHHDGRLSLPFRRWVRRSSYSDTDRNVALQEIRKGSPESQLN